jgi:AcrR family transcriptional regulator
MNSIKELPLRERRRARTRLAFLDSAIKLMSFKRFSDITVKELCEEVEVSEMTFFNHFTVKGDLLLYAIRLWSIEAAWHAQKKTAGKRGLEFLDAVYDQIAVETAKRPRIILDIFAWHASEPESATKDIPSISVAERRLRFPELEDIEDIPEGNMLTVLTENFRAAVASGEIPAETDINEAVLAASSIFFGIPMMLAVLDREHEMSATYRRHLNRLWNQIKAPEWSDSFRIGNSL